MISYIASGSEHAFDSCITNCCTIPVPLTLNDTLKSGCADSYADCETGDGPGALRDELKGDWTVWQPGTGSRTYQTGDPEGGWPASRIRAMLNGTDENTDTAKANQNNVYLRTEAEESTGANSNWSWRTRTLQDISTINASNCLLSCFPEELQKAIVAKEVKSDTVYNKCDASNVATTYDKLWLFSTSECGYGKRPYGNEGSAYPSSSYSHYNLYYLCHEGLYTGSNTSSPLLRSLSWSYADRVYGRNGVSWYAGDPAGSGRNGIAPGFVVGQEAAQ